MTIPNLDYQCYLNAVTAHAAHARDWLRLGYAPAGYYLKDFCLIENDGEWHLFHIAGTPAVSCCLPGNEIWFGHAVTRDFVTWRTESPCFYIDPASTWDNGHVFAPYVLRRGGEFWMFYTGCALDNTQRVGAAVSTDLFHWRRVSSRPLIRPEEYPWAFCPTEKGSACRDPHVVPEGDGYALYYTAVTREGRACVARAVSGNLLDWRDDGPAYTAPTLAHCESSNIQRLDDRWLLFFGGHYEHWSYVVSDNPRRWPAQEPVPLWKGITALEVVARVGRRWLVTYFKLRTLRLFVGVIDWSGERPEVRELRDAAEVAALLSEAHARNGNPDCDHREAFRPRPHAERTTP